VNALTEELFAIRNPAPTIFGVGLIALDVIMVPNNSEKMWTGGSCGNVLTILNWLDWQSYPIANLKNDKPADIIYRDLDYWKIELNFIIRNENGRTPIIIEKLKNNGIHKFTFKCPIRGTSLPRYKPISVGDVNGIVLQEEHRPSVFYFDRVSKSAIALAREFADRGTIVVFEPCSVRNKELFHEALDICHILKYSREQRKIFRKINSRPMPILEIETLGSEGLRYRADFGSINPVWETMKAYELKRIVDTAGAGDWCTAGIIHSLCHGGLDGFEKLSSDKLKSGLRFGQALAAFNCLFEGARGAMYLLSRDKFEKIILEILFKENHADIVRMIFDKIESDSEHMHHNIGIDKISYTSLVKCIER
jgi:sugar/nucleoside kinase (ribokinase family)